MANFIDNWRDAFAKFLESNTPKVRHFSDFTEEEKQRYRSMQPVQNTQPSKSNGGSSSSGEAPGLAWSQMVGTETLYDGVPGDIRVMKRVPMGGTSNAYTDGGDTNDVTVDDVVTGMVIRGMYGEGEDRKERLYKDGFNYDRVMKRVNDAYRTGKQDYYGKLTDKYGIRYRRRSGNKYAGGQQYYIPDDYIGRQY